jgi:hypothetical protein
MEAELATKDIIKSILDACEELDKSFYEDYKTKRLSNEEVLQDVSDMHLVKATVTRLFGAMQDETVERIGFTAAPINVEGATIEVKSGSSRKAWDHSALAQDVAQRIYESSIDIDTGEVNKTPREMMADMLKYGAVSYWRVGALKDLNIDPDEYCEVSPPKSSLVVRRDK